MCFGMTFHTAAASTMAKSTPVPIYSLPNTNGLTLPPEDDWTRAKDRREKKKIQNRVAQRTYRKPVPCTVKRIQRLTVTRPAHESSSWRAAGKGRLP